MNILLQPAREIIRHRRHKARRVRRNHLPGSFDFVRMAVGHVLGHGKVADLGKIRRLHCILTVQRESERQLHIRLPAAEPHIAHHDVFQLHRLAPSDLHRVRSARLGRIDLHLPSPIATRRSRGRVTANLHTDGVARLRPAPDRIRFAALQDHVVAKDGAYKRQLPG